MWGMGTRKKQVQVREGRDEAAPTALDVVNDALMHDIAMKLVTGQAKSVTELCRMVKRTRKTLDSIMTDPRFAEIYVAISDKFLTNTSEVIVNEEADVAIRARHLEKRGQTLLAAALEKASDFLKDGYEAMSPTGGVVKLDASPAHIRAATDAARTAFAFSPRRAEEKAASGTSVQVNVFTPNDRQAVIINAAKDEAGVDLGYMDAEFVEDPDDD